MSTYILLGLVGGTDTSGGVALSGAVAAVTMPAKAQAVVTAAATPRATVVKGS